MGKKEDINMAPVGEARTGVFMTEMRAVAGASRKQEVWDGGPVQASR